MKIFQNIDSIKLLLDKEYAECIFDSIMDYGEVMLRLSRSTFHFDKNVKSAQIFYKYMLLTSITQKYDKPTYSYFTQVFYAELTLTF